MTAQLHERLLLDGRRVSMASAPRLPDCHPQIVPGDAGSAASELEGLGTTACWRNYLGTWSIEGDRLFLVALHGAYRLVGPPIFAAWVTDLLRVPQGPAVRYVHMGFDTVYARELLLDVVEGVVVDRWIDEHDPLASS